MGNSDRDQVFGGGGVSVVWREDARWQVEDIINFGPNVTIFLLVLGSWRWYISRANVPPNDAPDVHLME